MPNKDTTEKILGFAKKLPGIDIEILRQGLEIVHFHRQVENVVEKDLAAWGLTVRQVEIMESLYFNTDGVMTPAGLSEEVDLTRSAMTSLLDSLEKRGYTTRDAHPSDRRSVAISLTKSGREFIGERLAQRYQKISSTMSSLSKQERKALLSAYQKILSRMIEDIPQDKKETE